MRAVDYRGPKAGTILSGHLRIDGFLGQGAMGIVLEATDLPTQQRVAVKIMAPESAKSREARKRFLREARAAIRLSSEHITRVLDFGELHDGTPFLVMEYLDGCTLEAALVRDGPPTVDVAIDWILQALDGVAEAHRAGFVHRDLKPENLFLCERPGQPPIVKVLDFGMVKDLLTKNTTLTRAGSTMGSPAYMPPEQVRAEAIDQRTDVWALGVTLYELTTGKLPFSGRSVPETLAAILRDQPIPLRTRRPDAPPALEALIACALSKDPARRYPSATEMLVALSAVEAELPETTRATKTVHVRTNVHRSRPDELAATAAPHAAENMNANHTQTRVIVHEQNVDMRQKKTRANRVVLSVVIVTAAIVLIIGGIFLLRRLVRRPVAQPVGSANGQTVDDADNSPVIPRSTGPRPAGPAPTLALGAAASHASRSANARSAIAW